MGKTLGEPRVVLVAGASRGIGATTARALAAAGHPVGLLARDADALDAQVAAITAAGGRALALPADVGDPEQVDAALHRMRAELGAPAALIWSVAPRFVHQKLHELDDAEIGQGVDIDLVAALRLLRRVLPDMMRAHDGRIVLLSSRAASHGLRGAPLYVVSKAGLEGLVRSLTVDYAAYGITANALRLGFVDGERVQYRAAGDVSDLKTRAATRSLVQPDEVADAIRWLLTAPSTTGAVIDVDGGIGLAVR